MSTRVELVYGKSGSGKTTWIMQLAEHFYELHGLKTRWYIGDGGFETVQAAGLVEAGIVEAYQFNTRENPLETCQFICEGYWPENPDDPKTKLLPPNYEKLKKEYGLFVIEGLSVMADYVMGDKVGGLAEQAGRKAQALRDVELSGKPVAENIKKAMAMGGGIDSPYVVTDSTGNLVYGGVSMSGFGFVQRRMENFIERSRVLPGWVYWTAHERAIEAKDNDDTNEPLVGPDVAGKKLTGVIGRSFGNTIHMHQASIIKSEVDPVTKNKVDHRVVQHRAYIKSHYDPDGRTFIRYYANNRMPVRYAADMPEYLHPADPLKFYSILDEAKRKYDADRKRKVAV